MEEIVEFVSKLETSESTQLKELVDHFVENWCDFDVSEFRRRLGEIIALLRDYDAVNVIMNFLMEDEDQMDIDLDAFTEGLNLTQNEKIIHFMRQGNYYALYLYLNLNEIDIEITDQYIDLYIELLKEGSPIAQIVDDYAAEKIVQRLIEMNEPQALQEFFDILEHNEFAVLMELEMPQIDYENNQALDVLVRYLRRPEPFVTIQYYVKDLIQKKKIRELVELIEALVKRDDSIMIDIEIFSDECQKYAQLIRRTIAERHIRFRVIEDDFVKLDGAKILRR